MSTFVSGKTSMKKILVATVAWALVITGCSESDKKEVTATPSFEVEQVTKSAWLFGSLPENTIAYVRAPNIWAGFSAKDDSFKYALGNKEHVKAIRQIQQGVYDNILAKLDDAIRPVAEFYAKHTVAPVELAFVNQNGQPVSFVATQLDYKNDKEFNDAIVSLTQGIPNANLMANDGEATGVIGFGPGAAVYYRYDSGSQKLTLVSGMGASVTSLENAAATIKPNEKHQMLKLEQDIDSSHEGLFAWVSPKNSMPFMQMVMPPEKLQQLKELGLDQAEGLAFGYGVSGGKTRLKLLVDMPDVGVRQFIPRFEHQFDVKSVGEPDSVAVIAWPSKKQVDTVLDHVEKINPDIKKEFADASKLFETEIGLSIDDLFILDGSSILRVKDEVGAYWVWKHNPQKWAKFIKVYEENLGSTYSVTDKSGVKVHHLKVPMVQDDLQETMQSTDNPMMGILTGMNQHLYWIEDGGYIIYSSVPQVLLERAKRGADTDVASWLSTTQGIDYSDILLGYTASVKGLSRTSYHYYLELLIQLADISGTEIDLLSLPTAGELGFPDKGVIGVSLTSGSEHLGLEFTFENGATDIMVGAGGAATVAMIGIMAAVAIPAYQDYTVRAQMTSGVYAAETLKLQIAESLAAGAKVEDIDNGFEGIKQPEEYATSVIEKMVVNDGVITVFFSNANFSLGYGPQTIVYVPMFDGQRITFWDCTGGSVAEKYRPARCK